MSSNISQQGAWSFEVKTLQSCKCCNQVKQIFCRKTPKYGQPYSACAVITIIDNCASIDLLLNKDTDSFTKKDYLDFSQYLTGMGLKRVNFKRMNNGKSKNVMRNDKPENQNLAKVK